MKRAKHLLLIGDPEYLYGIINGVHDYCRLHGRWEYHMESDSPEGVKRAHAVMETWHPDGIIAQIRYPRVEQLVRGSNIAAVNISGVRSLNIPTVISDHAAMGKMAARHLLDNGFGNLAFVVGGLNAYLSLRAEGAVREAAAVGVRCELFNMTTGGKGMARRLDRWLWSLPKPVGIICDTDYSSQEISWACRRLELRVPDDVALVGQGNHEVVCHMCNPTLSSVDPDPRRLGYEVARLLDRLVRGGKPPRKSVLIAPREVITRQSSDNIAIADQDVAAVLRYIRDHAGEPLAIKHLLGEVAISRKTLERRFAQLIGHTPKKEIARVRLQRVRQLLDQVTLPIKGVVRAAGFSSAGSLWSFFHRETGMSPGEYRRKSRLGHGIDVR